MIGHDSGLCGDDKIHNLICVTHIFVFISDVRKLNFPVHK